MCGASASHAVHDGQVRIHASSAVVLAYSRPHASDALTGGRRNRLETLRDSETCLQDIDISLYLRKSVYVSQKTPWRRGTIYPSGCFQSVRTLMKRKKKNLSLEN